MWKIAVREDGASLVELKLLPYSFHQRQETLDLIKVLNESTLLDHYLINIDY